MCHWLLNIVYKSTEQCGFFLSHRVELGVFKTARIVYIVESSTVPLIFIYLLLFKEINN